jgi:transcriptional regulator with XRE-family HTH domain
MPTDDTFPVNLRAMLHPAQCRAARAILDMTQKELAARAGVPKLTLQRFERAVTSPMATTRDKIERAIQAAGVELVDDPATGAYGVILRR